jgi:hypothetical protein
VSDDRLAALLYEEWCLKYGKRVECWSELMPTSREVWRERAESGWRP